METTPQIQNHLAANSNLSKKDIIVGNFLGGLSWGAGSVVGATVVIAVIGAILNTLGVFNFIGGIFEQINSLKQLNQQVPQIPQLPR